MLLSYLPGVVAAMLLLLAPGLIWAWWCYPAPERATRLAVGSAIGFAYQVHVCALLAWGPGITQGTVLLATVVGLVLAAALVWRTRLRFPALRGGDSLRHSLQLVALLAVVEITRVVPLVIQTIPAGWDPSFHSLLASTTLTSHRLPTWSPFEQIPSNYPYGPHVFIAELSLVTGIAPDKVFTVLLNGVLPLLTGLALYALARRVLRGHLLALGAVAAYTLLGNWGSIEYLQWGGLPNELGFFMLLTFLVILFAPAYNVTRIVAGGIILGAIPLSHHHVMLTTVILLCVYVAYLAVRWWLTREQPALRELTVRAFLRLAVMAGIGLATVAYYVVPLALRAGGLGSTNVGAYFDDYSGVLFYKNGLLLWELAGIGAALLVVAMLGYHRAPAKLRVRFAAAGTPGLARAFVISSSATLLCAFFLFYSVYRYISYHFTSAHQPYTLFTPTRFLTDLTYFLAFFAAIPLAWLWQWSVDHLPRVQLSPATLRITSRVAVRAAITIVVLATTAATLNFPAIESGGHLEAGEAQAFAWIRANTPADTLVVNVDPNARWVPYFTQRIVSYTPVPVSEFTAGYVNEKRALSDELLNIVSLSPQPHVVAFAGMGDALADIAGRPIAVLTNQGLADTSAQLGYTSGPERVYLLGQAYQQMGITPVSSGPMQAQWWQHTATPPSGWNTLGSSGAAGWAATVPSSARSGSDAYLRLQLPGPLPAGASLACRVERDVAVYIDGQQLRNPCSGKLASVLALSAPGPHVVAVHAVFSTNMDPWLNILLAVPGSPSA